MTPQQLLHEIQSEQLPHWQQALANAVRSPKRLLELLDLTPQQLPALLPEPSDGRKTFPLRVPLSFVARMKKGDPDDPLLRQVLPLAEEQWSPPDFLDDPVGDLAASTTPGLLHKYYGRALLITTAACAVHCRYCFRRNFPYSDHQAGNQQWHDALQQLKRDNSISEVILSGGDPLSISDRRLAELVNALEKIPHLRRLRIHTRLPVVLPQRVCDPLLQWLDQCRLDLIVVIHTNHPNEINAELRDALQRLRENRRITLLNQSVLLRGINDRADTLIELSEKLFACGVLPYYLHLLDRATGTAHFEPPREHAIALYRELHARLPGYLVPKFAEEIAGAQGKRLLPLKIE